MASLASEEEFQKSACIICHVVGTFPGYEVAVIREYDQLATRYAGLTALGVPDPKWGEAGKAFVVLNPDAGLDLPQLLEYCAAHLAKYKIPKSFVFVGHLPLSPTGKINRLALRDGWG